MAKSLHERLARAVAAIEARAAWLPPLAARVTVGWIFAQSGWGKLRNLDKVVEFFASLGIPAPQIQAPLAACTELVCGVLLLAGLATRAAALPLIVIMVVALRTALADRIGELGDLFALAEFCYVVLLLWLAVSGAGPVSLDASIARRLAQHESLSKRVIPTRAA
jgi:putative oxidoreductase